MTELVIATRNLGKVREIGDILRQAGVEATLRSLADRPGVELPPETGDTFTANAIAKAQAAARATGQVALADDSGIEVEALGGAPGVMSNRFAGEGAPDQAKYEKLLGLLQGVEETRREARFRCVVAVASPDGEVRTVEGTCEGRIAEAPRGGGGFGYDPVFVPAGLDRTMAELTAEEKNRLSHRGRAVRAAVARLRELGFR